MRGRSARTSSGPGSQRWVPRSRSAVTGHTRMRSGSRGPPAARRVHRVPPDVVVRALAPDDARGHGPVARPMRSCTGSPRKVSPSAASRKARAAAAPPGPAGASAADRRRPCRHRRRSSRRRAAARWRPAPGTAGPGPGPPARRRPVPGGRSPPCRRTAAWPLGHPRRRSRRPRWPLCPWRWRGPPGQQGQQELVGPWASRMRGSPGRGDRHGEDGGRGRREGQRVAEGEVGEARVAGRVGVDQLGVAVLDEQHGHGAEGVGEQHAGPRAGALEQEDGDAHRGRPEVLHAPLGAAVAEEADEGVEVQDPQGDAGPPRAPRGGPTEGVERHEGEGRAPGQQDDLDPQPELGVLDAGEREDEGRREARDEVHPPPQIGQLQGPEEQGLEGPPLGGLWWWRGAAHGLGEGEEGRGLTGGPP